VYFTFTAAYFAHDGGRAREKPKCLYKSFPAFYLKNSALMINASLLEAFELWTMSLCVCVCVWQIWKHFTVSRRGLCDWTNYVTPGLKRLCTTARASASHPAICGMRNSTGFTTQFVSIQTAYSICRLLQTIQLGNLWLWSIINTHGFLELHTG